ncbi:hypothetical protein J6590_098656, partial [Homalodisca vitripennis]
VKGHNRYRKTVDVNKCCPQVSPPPISSGGHELAVFYNITAQPSYDPVAWGKSLFQVPGDSYYLLQDSPPLPYQFLEIPVSCSVSGWRAYYDTDDARLRRPGLTLYAETCHEACHAKCQRHVMPAYDAKRRDAHGTLQVQTAFTTHSLSKHRAIISALQKLDLILR